MEEIRMRLYSLQDPEYRAFHSRLMPEVPTEKIIGVRIPLLRALARELYREGKAETVFSSLPHETYEELNLHGFLIEYIRDYDVCVKALEQFLPYVDNWATCDMVSPKVLGKHRDRLLEQIKAWLRSDHDFTVRYGLGMLMRYYLDEEFKPGYLELAAGIKREGYYVRMMVAWFFATALYKQYEASVQFLQERRLPQWVHIKTISKACDSRRVTKELKEHLKSLRRKE